MKNFIELPHLACGSYEGFDRFPNSVPLCGFVIQGITKPIEIVNHHIYKSDEKEIWKIKLLISLMEIRDQRWEILFDQEEGTVSLRKDDITDMIDSVASS